MNDTVHVLEALWTTIAVVGGVFSVANVYDAWIDRGVVPPKDRRGIIANTAVRVETARLGIQSICLAIGLVAMTLPEPPPDLPVRQGVAKFVIEWGLIGIVMLVGYQSVENRRMRRRLLGERRD